MDKETEDKVRSAAKKWANKRGPLIMALHEVQNMLGYVPWEAAEIVATELDVHLARVYEVLSFYIYFKLELPGKVVISICDGTACHIKGGEDLVAVFEKALKIQRGTTTPDGLFHLQIVRCLGCCGLAPVVVVNGKTYGKVTAAGIPKIIEEWQEKVK